ncbi:hypothetical protein MKW98_001561 [Papaver atlanticum]|uniref:Pectinesterase inhibitor domain-containing protein n=1 Tax=Papaver atlanticum TaxID=357466 RepID=A0AAD4S9L4_9MAGN|nr:hypothetical protein MKW98_001561 [Papaver atlanticum]
MSPTFSSLSLSSIFIVFLFLNIFSNHGANGDLISDVCKYASTSDPQLKYEFCIGSLLENPASKDAHDLLGLGEISMQACLQNATSIQSYIDKILSDGKQGPEPKTFIHPIKYCFMAYGVGHDFIHLAIAAFQIKDYSEANIWMGNAMGVATECEKNFKKRGMTSLLTKQDDDFVQLTKISLGIIRTVVKK